MNEPQAGKQGLMSKDFLLLFGLTLASNCYIAIFYCFEQWLEGLGTPPEWRGILLGALFAMVIIFRPVASVYFQEHSSLGAVVVSVIVTSLVMAAYQLVPPGSALFVWVVLALRIVQGFFLAVFSACTVSTLVTCIPPGQGARGFALFSLSLLLPYSIIPSIGEYLLPIVGGEAELFAITALMGIPALFMAGFLAPKLRLSGQQGTGTATVHHHMGFRETLKNVEHAGLGVIFLGIFLFGMTTNTCIFFIKGLTTVTKDNPAHFFLFYTVTIMLLRVLGNRSLDRLPRTSLVVVCSLLMSAGIICIAWGPHWAYIPATIAYGVGLALAYPLMAAIIYDRSAPDMRSFNSNFMMLMFDISRMLAPVCGGMVLSLDLGYRGVFATAAITQALCGFLTVVDWLLHRQKKNRA